MRLSFPKLSVVELAITCLTLFMIGSLSPLRADEVPQDEVPRSEALDESDEDVLKLEPDDEYFELLRLFADTLDQIDRNYVKDVSRRELMQAAIEGMLTKLDQFSNYIAPDDVERFKGSVESEFGGIGIQVRIQDRQLTVISPIVGSPAYEAGLQAGDKIIAIEGKPTKGITIDEAVKRMKGKVGTEVTVTVIHLTDRVPEDINVKRAIVRIKTVLGDKRHMDDSWDFFLDKEKKIGFVRLTAFTRNTADELRSAIQQLLRNGMRGLILDMRFNPGGLLSAAIEVCDLFVREGLIVSTEGRNVKRRTWDAHRRGTFPDFPMAILVNQYSASASEIVSGCLQDHGRAVIIGQRTFGKGSVQNIIELEGGKSALKLTTAGYQRPSGKNIHRFDGATDEEDWGVRPDEGYKVTLSIREIRRLQESRYQRDIVKNRDESGEQPQSVDRQLAKANDYLDSQLPPLQVDAEEKSEEAKSEEAASPERESEPVGNNDN